MFGRQCWISVNVALTLVLGATIPPARAAPTPTLLLKYIPPTSHSVNSILESCSDSWSIVSFLFLYCQYPKHTPSPWYARSSSIDIENPPEIRTAALSSRPSSPANGPAAASGSSISRPSSPTPPGGPRTAIRRRAAADQKEKLANARPSSTRAAGAGGSSSTMLRLYTDESPGLKVDPVVVLVLSLVFIFSVVALHIIAKISRKFSS
ncbi:hypothetical protein M441DRAFT_39768 [Trichoderma asperellum CBS 433.97]|uniref:Protein transport protein Sec61 subunit beta n=1 Tax=Trichoderma asperellum (strain ATCC 204424 / CBS 433.97 / NBRC 101777) TaxID=1042311 RepID=A0A2T3YZ14_TRIA4|nr:hypothetical protein M441DRAFT_39768 [Trichoderma asperellum CBS 433.97]PTB37785.1 hypothetical protein M441DRAFT_39768 [Trichoderma asperellum CBS 433.97]